MKRISILWGVLLLLAAVACTEDKGNYDYVPLNELTLEGMLGEYEVEQDSTLAITMTITGKEGFSESDYDFVWYAWSETDEDAIPDTLSYEKDLNVTISLPIDSYTLRFMATEKETGVYYSVHADLSVINSFSKGVVALSRIEGGDSDVTFINSVNTVTKHAYKEANGGVSAGKQPRGVYYLGGDNGTKNVLLIATIANIVCRIAAFFVGYEGIRIVYTGILLAICGIPNGMVGIASTAIWGDSIDYEEWRTGVRNEGAVFSMQNLVGKMGSGLSIFFTGITLKLLDFDATKYDLGLPQSETFNKLIFPVYILAPALGSLLYLIPLLFMKYDVNAKHKLEALLRERRKGIKIAEATHSVGADPELIDTSIF